MPSLTLPPLPSPDSLPLLPTVNSLGEYEVTFAVRELWAADEVPPERAIEIIRRNPQKGAALIFETLEDFLLKYNEAAIDLPRAFGNCLIVLASLQQADSADLLLTLLQDVDENCDLVQHCENLLPTIFAEMVSDITTWQSLVTKYNSVTGTECLFGALPAIVFRESLDRHDAAARIVRHFDSLAYPFNAISAASAVDALLDLAVPETKQDIPRINAESLQDRPGLEKEIERVFEDPEASARSAAERLQSQRLLDPILQFHLGEYDPPLIPLPESIEDAIEEFKGMGIEIQDVLRAYRRLRMTPEQSTPVLLEYIAAELRTQNSSEEQDADEPDDHSPGYAVRMLLEFRCPHILPLLLPAVEKSGADCLGGFRQLVEPVLEEIGARTAPSLEFLADWVRRLEHAPQIASRLVEAIVLMVIEGRADRLQAIACLRELFIHLLDHFIPDNSAILLDKASYGLACLGDVACLEVLTNSADVPAECVSQVSELLAYDRVTLERIPQDYALMRLLDWRFFMASDSVLQEMLTDAMLYDESDSSEDHEDDFFDDFDDESTFDGYDSFVPDISGGLPLPTAQLNLFTNDNPGLGDDNYEPTGTIRNSAKIGRNDPCPCGSGRKYKKCCGN
jgi:hypothetical protein